MPLKEACQHLSLIGTIGSGKTTLIRLFLQSIAPRFRKDWPGPPEQLVLFDAKTEIIPILAGMGLTAETTNLHILNPYDKRGVSWTIAESLQEPAMALNFATMVVPEEPHSSAPFFSHAGRDMVFAAILGLSQSLGVNWTLRDLILALDSHAHLVAVARNHPRAAALLKRAFRDEKHVDAVLSHVGARLVRLEPLAALWHTTLLRTRFTVDEFLSHPGVLVLGGDPTLHQILSPLNSFVLKAISQQIIRGSESALPRRWFVLDEFAAMGRIDCIPDLLRLGRSKGASVLLGVQNIEGLRALYQRDAAEDILSLCTYKSILRAGGPETASWASEYFGSVRRQETTHSQNWGKGGWGGSVNYSIVDRHVFLPSMFMALPIPAPGRPFIGIHDVPSQGQSVVTNHLSDVIFSWVTPAAKVDPLQPRTCPAEQTLSGWDAAEEIHITGLQPPKKEPVKPQDPTEHLKEKQRRKRGQA